MGGALFALAASIGVVAVGCDTQESRSQLRVFSDAELIDLSHAYGADTIFWPTADPFRLEVVSDGVTDQGYIDYGQSTLFETHRTLFAHDIPAFENLAALERLPPTGAVVVALPMKIAGGSGAPLRAVALVPR